MPRKDSRKKELETILNMDNITINNDEEIVDLAPDNFLDDLNNENFVEPPTVNEIKEQEKAEKEMKREHEKQQKEILKQMKSKPKQEIRFNNIIENNSDLFSDVPTEILGKDKLETINKLNQYKQLFPKELSKFKVKKNASIDELKIYLQEAESLVEISSVDGFITDSILQCVKLSETVSKKTRFDISGCSDMLKANPNFHKLLKQLYLKYGCFAKLPCEMQLLLMVSTTAYMCVNKNKNKANLEQFLNEPVKI